MKLWDKGYSIDKKIESFTVGNDREIDLEIAKYDVQASIAHAVMLASIGLLSSEELAQLKTALKDISADIESGDFVIENDFEDVHSKIEFELTKSPGDVGKKIHTARSRNDQVLVALQLYYKDNLNLIDSKIKVFFETLLS
ncbi:MAG: argininosuccinate lyase, partial [Lentisphaeria bacterium]|nr:argininosuccinate lyase [Lentisphaeria bacterium]